MKLHLALLCLVPLVAGAITTTLEYEDTREAASRSAVSNEIATAVAPLASTNQLASATNAVAVALRDEIAASQPADYANVSNKAMTAIQLANIAPNFATPREYKPGDLVIKDGELCVCIQAGAGENAVFMSAQVCDGIAQLRKSLAAVALSGAYSDISGAPTNVSAFTNDAGYLTSFTETDPTISSWAKAANKPSYTASEVGALPDDTTHLSGDVPTSRTVNGKALSSNITLSASDVGAATAADVYRIVAGTNVVLVITNYNSAVHAPSMKLQRLDPQSGQYVTYWDEQRRHGITLTNAMQYADAVAQTRAPAAWSGTTSGLGAEAPAGVTWISTPETVIAGGYEYEKVATTAGAVWVLSSNGLSTGATTNSFFRIAAADGTEIFSIEKTDSYLVGVSADDITRSGNTVTIPVNVVAPSHPYIRATTNLVNAVWTKEDENGFTCPFASVSWSGSSGAYVATVTTAEPQAFFYFEYMVEGQVKIKNSAKTDLSGGIIYKNKTYYQTVNGNKLEFVAP